MSIIDDVLKLLGKGYLPYQGHVEGHVYESLGCAPGASPGGSFGSVNMCAWGALCGAAWLIRWGLS